MIEEKTIKKHPCAPPPRDVTRKRRENILTIIENVGFWNLSVKALSEKYEVSKRTIYDDIKHIKKNVTFDTKEVKINIAITYKRAINEIMRIINSTTILPGTKINAINALNNTNRGFIDVLHSFGILKKMPDDMTVTNINHNLNADLTDEETKDLLSLLVENNEEVKKLQETIK